MKRILIADVAQMDARYDAALCGWEIAFVRTLSQARRALAERYDLVVIGVYFDDSQMFDLVREIRADPRCAGVPILGVRARTGFTSVSARALEVTLKALAADEFIDLALLGDDAAGNSALRAAARRLLKEPQ
jgi:DNA-binding response OmpR family regulator